MNNGKLPENRLLVYLSAYGSFEKFLVISAYFYLSSLEEALVEVAVPDLKSFNNRYSESIALLEAFYPGRFHISEFELFETVPRATRFLQQPEWIDYASHVFIADVDVLNLDSDLFEDHVYLARQRNVPFSNVLRPREEITEGYPRLTGCHFTARDAYYPVPSISELHIPKLDVRGADENILFQIVSKKLDPVFQSRGHRPIHGIHITPSRRPFGREFRHLDSRENLNKLSTIQLSADRLGLETSFWQGVANLNYRQTFLRRWSDDIFRKIYFFLESSVQQRLLLLKVICEGGYAAWQHEAISRYLPHDLYSPAVLHSRASTGFKRQLIDVPGVKRMNNIFKRF